MLIVFIVAFIIIGLFVVTKYMKDSEKKEKPYTETICGNCGGPDCPDGCDKPYDPCEVADKASDKLDKDFCKAIGIEQPKHTHTASEITSASFIKPEKDRIVTADEIRHTAYLLASADNFSKNPDYYWIEAEKQLKGTK